jgi:hypothetical protein
MFMGWRMQTDLETLAGLPDGALELNLLRGTASHKVAGPLDLYIAKEIQAWLQQESTKDGVDLSQLNEATLVVDIKTDLVKTNKKKVVCFSFNCNSRLVTNEKTYSANVAEVHKWHERIAP